MSNLSQFLTDYRAKLVTAGFVNVDQNVETGDTQGTVDKKFRLTLEGSAPRTRDMFGGGALVERERQVTLELSWEPENNEGTVWNTLADDELAAVNVMEKASNRGVGIQKVTAAGGFTRTESTKEVKTTFTFDVVYRETANLL